QIDAKQLIRPGFARFFYVLILGFSVHFRIARHPNSTPRASNQLINKKSTPAKRRGLVLA
ncbi:hypothetical protein, partial [Serratia marcescens]|uniref:hypothetical protein n=1 Tax=Serratia marcescens TaxID=615 RepID=UPI001C647CB6